MAFNSNTYHANKSARLAKEGMAKARDIKERAAKGEAYDWEVRRLPLIVSGARLDAKMSRLYRSLNH